MTVPRAAFERRERLATSTPALDQLEERWWNEHAPLMERLWALPEDVRIPLRSDFAQRARAFFGRGRILEIACGTGWPGRMIAGDGLRIIGIDLSREQIERARAEAKRSDLSDHCEYRHGDIANLLDLSVDGVFVHAGLHHLANDEVAALLERLARPGLKVLLYEPVYPRLAPLPSIIRRSIRVGVELLVRLMSPRRRGVVYDAETSRLFDAVVEESSRAGWFLSPKEVPFDEAGLEELLRQRFEILRQYPCHFRSFEIAQRIGLMTDDATRRRAVSRFLHPALLLDRILFATRAFRVFEAQYVFYAFELLARSR